MPGEWHCHRSTWMAWPHDSITFPDRIPQVERVFAEIVFHLHQAERIDLIVLDASMQTRVEKILRSLGIDLLRVTFHCADYADVWIRDWGPSFLLNQMTKKQDVCIKWQYNAYGNKFPDLLKDDRTFFSLHDASGQTMFDAGVIMEGGSFDVNGAGALLTTGQCLLNPNRNPQLDQEQIEKTVQTMTGSSHVIWLKNGIFNDHTDGHIDDVARFVDPRTIVMAETKDASDPNYAVLQENWRILKRAVDQDGQPFRLVALPMPKMYYDDRQQAPASYANFYIANQHVLVPQYDQPEDSLALEILQSRFSDRKVVGIDCRDLIYGGGAIHCITQQQPEF